MSGHDVLRRLIAERDLAPHPEGGWFREIRRTEGTVATPWGERAPETAIEFLLAAGQVSRLHRLRQEEVWSHLEGPGLDLHLLAPDGTADMHRIAADTAPATVPAGVWMGAEAPGGWALVRCVCRPGFEYDDLEFAAREALLAAFPDHEALIRRLVP